MMNEKGFTLIEYVTSFAMMMIVLMAIFNLVGVNLLNVQISRHQELLKNVAQAHLDRLKSLNSNHPDLQTFPPVHSTEVMENNLRIGLEWRVTDEDIGSERITVKLIRLTPFLVKKPLKVRTYVARVYFYN